MHAPLRQSRRSSPRILDDQAGHWSIRPDTDFHVERDYVAGSMVLLTTFHTPTGTLELRDALVPRRHRTTPTPSASTRPTCWPGP